MFSHPVPDPVSPSKPHSVALRHRLNSAAAANPSYDLLLYHARYDGNGQRVQKTVNESTTTYVYDAFGNLAAEYATTAPGPRGTEFYTADHLGSTRLITSATGGVLHRYDYLPFGEGLGAGVNGRSTMYSAYNGGAFPGADDGESAKFTGKERDAETGLDYFGARYFSGAQGRFTSPDEPLADQGAGDPQSWNLYGYVRNNPLRNVDPDGQDCITTSNQTDASVSVTVAPGACNGNVGTYVSGTVDMGSLTYNGTSVGYSFTPYDTSSSGVGFGTLPLGPAAPGDALSPYAQEFYNQMSARRATNNGIIASFALGQAAFATAFASTYALPAAITAMAGAAPLLPAVPSAIQKLQKIGLTLQEANEIVESPASQKLIDNANGGNINCIQQVGDKLVRITTDPTGQRIISAGYVRANSIVNGLANGRFTAK